MTASSFTDNPRIQAVNLYMLQFIWNYCQKIMCV